MLNFNTDLYYTLQHLIKGFWELFFVLEGYIKQHFKVGMNHYL